MRQLGKNGCLLGDVHSTSGCGDGDRGNGGGRGTVWRLRRWLWQEIADVFDVSDGSNVSGRFGPFWQYFLDVGDHLNIKVQGRLVGFEFEVRTSNAKFELGCEKLIK